MSNYTKVYNQLVALAQKRDRDQITAKEWNTVVGTLALQLNTMGANLDVLHEQLENMSEINNEVISEIMESLTALEEQTELLEFKIEEAGTKIIFSTVEPEEKKPNMIWVKPKN